MTDFEVGGERLAKVHQRANYKKLHCYLTGFLEGILASGRIEAAEIEPLMVQCEEFVHNLADPDAQEILEDLGVDLLDHAALSDIVEVRQNFIDAACAKSSVNRFMGFCAGIACDNIITTEEADELLHRAKQVQPQSPDALIKSLIFTCEDTLEDGIVSAEQSQEICEGITKIVGDSYSDTGLSSLGSAPIFEESVTGLVPADFPGKNIVLTGNFSIKPRRIIEEKLEELGATATKHVCGKTDFVVIAMEASRDWAHTHKGNKIAKALQLREASALPLLVGERTLLKALRLS